MTEPILPEESVFLQALEIEGAADRVAFLDQACGADARLRAGVEALLRASAKSGDLLDVSEQPGPLISAATIDQPPLERPGTQIGPFKLLEKIGEGGMGIVYMADQQEPVERRVALKIIKPGMDTRQVIARFEAERQALAMMDHPNIAKVFDAGTTDSGRPYFVMELVNGIPVTQFCDDQHLSARERLELFIPICQAVQHAHQKGIIHRDIKPSNILIALYDSRAVPKVIDFGVAKAVSQKLTEKTVFTGLGQIVGTLEYMSPEQAQRNQLDIDTRSDVYSLGVVLYELLTGDTPFDKQRLRSSAWDEMLRIIREEEPPKPSAKLSSSEILASVADNRKIDPAKLSALVRGELDWIVMKALEKDRSRRYETANLLAADVQHYLDDEPVEACPPSAVYRLGKSIRRHKVVLATTAIVLFTLISATAISAWQAIVANIARGAAATALHEKSMALGESEQRREQAEANLRMAAEAVDQFMRRVGSDRTFHGQVEHGGQFLAEAIDFYERILRQSADPAIRFEAGMAYRQSAATHLLTGAYQQAESADQRALQLIGDLVREQPDNPTYQDCLADCYNELGNALSSENRIADAEVAYRQALQLRQDLCAKFPGQPEYQLSLADPLGNLATIAWGTGKLDDAASTFRRVLAIEEGVPQDIRESVGHVMEHAGTLLNFAMLLREREEFAESQQRMEEVIRLLHSVLASQPDHPKARDGLYNALWNLAETLVVQGKHTEAAQAAEQLVVQFPKRLQAYHEAAELLLQCDSLARQSAEGTAFAQANEQRAKELLEQASAAPEATAHTRNRLAWFLANCEHTGFRNPPQAMSIGRPLVRQMPQDPTFQLTLGVACYRGAVWSEAVAALTECERLGLEADTWEPWRQSGPGIGRFFLAMSYQQLGNQGEARQWFDKAVHWMDEHPDHAQDLQPLRDEAAVTLGLAEKPPSTQEKAEQIP